MYSFVWFLQLILHVVSAPEQFGDTILFTTDEDILEAIYCYDQTYNGEMENASSLRYEEELKRPTTADREGEERPFTQAGLRTEDQQVGLDVQNSVFLTHDMEVVDTNFHNTVKLCSYPSILKIFFFHQLSNLCEFLKSPNFGFPY